MFLHLWGALVDRDILDTEHIAGLVGDGFTHYVLGLLDEPALLDGVSVTELPGLCLAHRLVGIPALLLPLGEALLALVHTAPLVCHPTTLVHHPTGTTTTTTQTTTGHLHHPTPDSAGGREGVCRDHGLQVGTP